MQTLKLRSKGDSVSLLQELLNKAGYNLVVDGDFGRKTERTVKDFQKKTVSYVFRRLYKDKDRVDRFLIADEVGLGKTIESGLILIEQRARNPLDRILVVCLSSLTKKWRDEMREKFGLDGA